MNVVGKVGQFLEDPNAWDMYVTGPAGTGKTTSMKEVVEYLVDNDVNYVVCAYTHKACDILRQKLPQNAEIKTLHSMLRKRPTINDDATHHTKVEVSRQHGTPEVPKVMLVDEFSMVGEKDYMDIVAMQDPEYEGEPAMKVIYVGDLNQLPPVGDAQTIVPNGDYWFKLTKVYRQKDGNELLDTLCTLVDFMADPSKAEALKPNKNFIRDTDIVNAYRKDHQDKVMLAFTNRRVQELNQAVADKELPEPMDWTWCPSNQTEYMFNFELASSEVEHIVIPYSGEQLTYNSKYKTLEHLLKLSNEIRFGSFDNEDDATVLAYVFGHENYRQLAMQYKQAAANANAAIEEQFQQRAKVWASVNNHHKLARARARAWRDYLTFKDCVCCIDFPYAMTVHKSQGSTFENVYLDTNDLAICAQRDFTMYLRLTYVAISRASNNVYTP